MSDMKCPFCQQELKPQTIDGGWLECWNCSYSEPNSKHLPQPILAGSKELWQELIRTRKALDVAVDALKSAKKRLELINNSKFANLNNVLQIQSQCEVLKINEALEQITAEHFADASKKIEQKDVK